MKLQELLKTIDSTQGITLQEKDKTTGLINYINNISIFELVDKYGGKEVYSHKASRENSILITIIK